MTKRKRRFLAFAAGFIFFVAVWNVFFETAWVDEESTSMMPVLYPLDSFLTLRHAPISRHCIIVLDDPKNPGVTLIKRVVGLPGETIQMRHGRMFINNAPISEPYMGDAYRSQETEPALMQLRIPDGHYYVLGDNRNFSRDSREFGPVHKNIIRGRVIAVIAPRENIKIF